MCSENDGKAARNRTGRNVRGRTGRKITPAIYAWICSVSLCVLCGSRFSKESMPEFPHQLRLPQDVSLHRAFQFALGSAGLETQLRVERVDFEKVAVRLAWRRARTTVPDLAKVIPPLQRPVGKLLLFLYPFRKFLH